MKKRKEKGKYLNAYLYISVMFFFNLLIFVTPILSMLGNPISQDIYAFFSTFCHQLFERSICMSSDFEIDNCDINSRFVYQFPICSRDMSFYFAMFLGGLVYVILGKQDEKEIPPLAILVLSFVPLVIDGITQFFGLRESNNFLRILTGSVAGFTIPFFLIPIMNRIQSSNKKS